MSRVSVDAVLNFTIGVIEAFGTPPDSARLVAHHLVDANLAGHDSHGIMRLPVYHEHLTAGQYQPTAQPTIVRESPTTALVDGGHGWGPVVAHFALDLAVQKARQQAMAAVSVRHAYHVGRLGPYPAKAADQGYLGVVFCNGTGGARVAPWGATESRLATNPIAMAIPTDDRPIVVDFATTAVAEGKVRLAQINGKKVPIGWVIGADGNFSTNPNDAYDVGTLALLGGDQGHKGYCLSVAMDVLAGLLSGGGAALMVPHIGNSLLIQVIDPAAFCDPAEFRGRVSAYKDYLKSAERREGVDEILLPGEIETKRTQQNREQGLLIEAGVLADLQQLGKKLGVESEELGAKS